MSAEPSDKISAELLSALEKLSFDFNRVVLQLLLDKGEMTIEQIEAVPIKSNISSHGVRTRIASLEKANLIQTTLRQDQTAIGKVKLTSFGDILIRGLLVSQKLLEAKHG